MSGITTILKELNNILKKHLDIIDKSGIIVYSSDNERIGKKISNKNIYSFPIDKRNDLYVNLEYDLNYEEIQLIKLILKNAITEGTDENYHQFLENIINGKNYSEEECRKFNIPYKGNFIVYIISLFSEKNIDDVHNFICNSYCANNNCWLINNQNEIVIIEEIKYLTDNYKSKALILKDMINTELYIDIYIGVGNIHNGIFNIHKSLEEAREAIRVGKIFNIPQNIYFYNDIFVERFVSQLPADKVQSFLNDIFKDGLDKLLDEELLRTAQVMFQNNLNVSDSSKVLYIHRNTLIYRLDKIQKITGLDIRKFEDAVVFKIGLLLRKMDLGFNKTL